jgi:hypothetical protein
MQGTCRVWVYSLRKSLFVFAALVQLPKELVAGPIVRVKLAVLFVGEGKCSKATVAVAVDWSVDARLLVDYHGMPGC